MKIKAKVSFCGDLTMAEGEVTEVAKETAQPLLQADYVEEIKASKKAVGKNEDK